MGIILYKLCKEANGTFAGAALLSVGCIAVLTGNNALADSAEWVARSWQTKEGLPQNTVYSITQTRDGYLWVGTAGGLGRFDGERFRTFGLADGLRSVEISSLCEDPDGVLWIGSWSGGLSRWHKGRLTSYSSTNGLAAAAVDALAADHQGNLWIGTSQGLVKHHDGAFKKIGVSEGLPEKEVRALLQDSKGVLWVSVLLEGLYTNSNGRFVRVEGTPFRPTGVHSLFEDRQGGIWAGGGGGIWQFQDHAWQHYGRTNGLPNDNIECFAQNKDGLLLIGTRKSGLFLLNQGRFGKWPLSMELPADSIRSLLTDREGTLWIGGGNGGLTRLLPRTVFSWGRGERLEPRHITSVAEDASGRRLIMTRVEGIYQFQDGIFNKLDDAAVTGSYPYAYCALSAEDGSIWAAGERFLYHFRPGEKTMTYLDPPIQGEAIRAMCEDGKAVWLGTYDSMLLKVDEAGVRVVETNGFFGGSIRCMVREAPDTLWVGTAAGLYKWASGTVSRLTAADGLLCEAIQALHRDSDGTLWIGTLGGGLARLKDGRVSNITTRQGLADDVISQVVADDFGHLWLGCNHGIMRLERRETEDLVEGKATLLRALLFDRDDGMSMEQCSGGHSPTAIKLRSGRLLFPTVDGVVEIDPQVRVGASSTAPETTIDEIRVDGDPQVPSSSLVLAPGARRLEIDYAAPNLTGNRLLRFRFRMEHLDKTWVNAGSRRRAFYPSIPPGKYVFKVSVGESKGSWKSKITSLAVTVEPYFWQTWWFQFLGAAAVCGLGFIWYFRRLAQLEVSRAAQEDFTRQLMLSQEQERKRIAGELHDGLGQDLLLIKNRVKLLASGSPHPPQLSQALAEISNYASRALSDVRAISHALRPSALEQVGLTKAIEYMIEQIAGASTTKFSTELDDIDGFLGPDMEISVYRIVQEGLNNVMKHAQATQVIVEIKRGPKAISVSIFDDGRGFDTWGPHTEQVIPAGFGLTGMSERAKAIGGWLELRSARGTGTRVTLSVPLSKSSTLSA